MTQQEQMKNTNKIMRILKNFLPTEKLEMNNQINNQINLDHISVMQPITTSHR